MYIQCKDHNFDRQYHYNNNILQIIEIKLIKMTTDRIDRKI